MKKKWKKFIEISVSYSVITSTYGKNTNQKWYITTLKRIERFRRYRIHKKRAGEAVLFALCVLNYARCGFKNVRCFLTTSLRKAIIWIIRTRRKKQKQCDNVFSFVRCVIIPVWKFNVTACVDSWVPSCCAHVRETTQSVRSAWNHVLLW